MADDLETFVKELTDSGIISPGKLENFIPPKAHPQSAEELIAELVKQNQLTDFQVQEINEGRGKSLTLGNYTILDKIGAGGMGQVFKAEHRRMHRVVAIKMLPSALTKDAAALARFEREVTAAAKLRHPNIVAADDADEANGVHFLVMEYVEGKDLSVLVKKNGPFPVAKAVNYILQAAKGLEFAHQKGVIHRDIKPANLLLGLDGTVKILDMGLARIDAHGGDAATQAELTSSGTIFGTVDFLAPEQALSTKHADARADIYSLGISLYYLIAGKAAYDGETLMAKMLAHRESPIPSLREVQAKVPDKVQGIFNKMVAKKKEDRYQTMTEVAADLEKCQAALVNESASAVTTTWQSSVTGGSELAFALGNKTRPKLSRPVLLGLVAAGLLGMAILAGVIFKLQTKDGTLIVEVDQPDAVVQILNEEGKVEISDRSGKKPITLSVNPGKHRLKVEKDGFVAFAENFEIEVGGKKAITAKLEPVKKEEVAVQPIKPWETSAFQAWMKEVQAMPAEKQIVAVAKKLVELNPGFEGKITPTIEKDLVTGLEFITDSVLNISPVRALAGLEFLNCSGSKARKGTLSDLSPLKGMKLAILGITHTQVSDLSPLQGMTLARLNCSSTQVSDLSPLQGMKLLWLGLYATPVSDLSPLQGMPLTTLQCPSTQVSDLSSLVTCKSLATLDVSKTKVTPASIAALQNALPNCKIEWDGSNNPTTNINDLAFQAWMKDVAVLPAEKQVEAIAKKLTELNPGFDGKVTPKIDKGIVTELEFVTDHLTDISPVRALPGLKVLNCGGSTSKSGSLFDLSPLRGMRLTTLNCINTLVFDLSPLKGMPLTILNFVNTQVSDLSPLQGMPLAYLQCYGTQVSDLSPLQGMPLKSLACNSTQVSDLSPLKGMKLTRLDCHQTEVSDLSPLEACKSLKALNIQTTKVTPAGVATLQKALPNCKIEWPTEGQFYDQLASQGELDRPVAEWVLSKGGFVKLVSQEDPAAEIRKLPNGKIQVKSVFLERGQPGKHADLLANAELENLLGLRSLLTLGIGGQTAITDEAIRKLAAISSLQSLFLPGTKISDAGLAHVKLFPGLHVLHLLNTEISDEGLLQLYGQKNLKLFTLIGTKVTPAGVAALHNALPKCKIEWPKTGEFYGEPAMPAKPIATLKDPAFQQWMKDVQALPAEKQVEAVTKKLMELNPGFDGKLTGHDRQGAPKIVKGVVTELEFLTDSVPDISPVRALAGLKALFCPGSGADKGILSDLSPLQGMALTALDCFNTQVSDLSPLKGMPITKLECNNTQVSDLLPLEGMPLTLLNCRATQVTDFSPLNRIQTLDVLNLNDTKITDVGLAQVRALTTLRRIALARTGISDNGLQHLSISTHLTDLDLHRTKVTPTGVAALQIALPACKINWDDPTKAAKAVTNINDPAFQQWMKTVAALPAEKQIEAVAKKLMELNPGFDGKITGYNDNLTPKIEKGVVTEVGFLTDNVTDISPVRALVGLKLLRCNGNHGQGKPSDLSPLQGLKLTILNCSDTQVFDLSPLRGMPLTGLHCQDTQVSDLSPLKGMPLTRLTCYLTQISDLSPLLGMPLTFLDCNGTQVSDLSPLKGMPLTSVVCHNTPVSDLSPLKGMPLTYLGCANTQVSILSPLEDGKSLKLVKVTGTKVTPAGVAALQKALPDCKIEWDDPAKPMTSGKPVATFNDPAFQQWMKDVAAMPAEKQIEAVVRKLRELNPGFEGNVTNESQHGPPKIKDGVVTEFGFHTDNVTDVSPVRALAGLRSLRLNGSLAGRGSLSDLSPLRGMKLGQLVCGATKVSNLSPLQGMPLAVFFCGDTQVADLSPLRGLPLTRLSCHHTQVSDLSPLEGMALTEIALTPTNITKGLNLIRQMKSLKTIGTAYGENLPPDEFWKKYDAGEFGKPITNINDPAFQQWMKGVAALPAEKQVEAVAKKLQELNPGFDGVVGEANGKGVPNIENGVVVKMGFLTDNVTDLSPVRALPDLMGLHCSGSSGGRGRLTDVSPLQGMKLRHLGFRAYPRTFAVLNVMIAN